MKKSYRIEITATAENIAALEAANITYQLYEVNEVRKASESFACGSNFKTTELILKAVTEMDTANYDPQTLKNYSSNLQRNLPHVMEKIVKL